MKTPAAATAGKVARGRAVTAAVVDAVLILAFAAAGRSAHDRGDVVSGVFLTAWPFLVGAAVSWVVLRLWRSPFAVAAAGVPVWLGSVLIGMLLRFATGQPVVPAFVIVALVSLGVLLPGYRLLHAAWGRWARRPSRS